MCVYMFGEMLEVEELGDVVALLEAVYSDVVFFDGRFIESVIVFVCVVEMCGIRVFVECE